MTTHPESPDGVETAKRGKPSCDLRKRASTKRSSPVVLVDATTGADGRIYAIGGCELVTDAVGNPVDCVDSKRVDAYSPRTKTWRTLDNSHAVHREGAAVTSGKRIFAIGGHTDAVESARWPTPNDPRPGPPEHPGLPGDP